MRSVLEKHKPLCQRNCGAAERGEQVDARDLENLNTILEAEVKQVGVNMLQKMRTKDAF